jgi:hypothetical protein
MAQSRVYTLTDPAAIAAKVLAAGGPVLDVSQSSGEATGKGIRLGWEVVGSQITVTLLDKPWAIPASLVWNKVDALFS